jgi:hypothetical protein
MTDGYNDACDGAKLKPLDSVRYDRKEGNRRTGMTIRANRERVHG